MRGGVRLSLGRPLPRLIPPLGWKEADGEEARTLETLGPSDRGRAPSSPCGVTDRLTGGGGGRSDLGC